MMAISTNIHINFLRTRNLHLNIHAHKIILISTLARLGHKSSIKFYGGLDTEARAMKR